MKVAGEAGGSVGQVPLVLLIAYGEADVGLPTRAVDAFAALGRKERHDVITRLHQAHALADLVDHAAAFVAEHHRLVAGGVGARRRVHVGVADAAGLEPHEHLPGLRLGELELLDFERGPELLEDRGAGPHSQALQISPM
jgi:hypothetical protein